MDNSIDHAETRTAYFRFYEELNDFIPYEKRGIPFAYTFNGRPSVKDCIEALGPPHTEVDLILANHVSVDFGYRVKSGDRISVYPVFETLDMTSVIRLRPKPLRESRFMLDTQLGKLARDLRMLGFDTRYRNDYTDTDLVELTCSENRILLTRNTKLLKQKRIARGFWIRSPQPDAQLEQVLYRLDLFSQIKPFTRCLVCNDQLEDVQKEIIFDRLEPRTARTFETFKRCTSCGRVYWKGSHHERMQTKIRRLIQKRRET